MKRKNGFTLIELLAVIVILAIIALIAVPVVMNIIDTAIKKSFMNSAQGLLRAGELYYSNKIMLDEDLTKRIKFTFPDGIDGLKIEGGIPNSGEMIIKTNGQIAFAINNGKYCIIKDYKNSELQLNQDIENCEIPWIMQSEASCIDKSEICPSGTPVIVKVNDKETYNFYVISDDGNELTMIMDKNLGERVLWYKDNDDTTSDERTNLGPVTALNYLNNQTLDWDNIPAIKNYTYDNNLDGTTYANGYQKLEIRDGKSLLTSQDGNIITEIAGESKARILSKQEIDKIYVENHNIMPFYLYANSPGYWLLTSHATQASWVSYMEHTGAYEYYSYIWTLSLGIRPVITLSK